MKHKSIIVATLFVFMGCRSSLNLMNGENPKKESFKYYNKNFKFDSTSGLKVNSKYVQVVDSASVLILVFFSDGFLNKFNTVSVKARSATRNESGDITGYYKTLGDSIFFTTASYYQRRPTQYQGRIKGDTLALIIKDSKYRDSIFKYVLSP